MSAIQDRINNVAKILEDLEKGNGTFVMKQAIKLRVDSQKTGATHGQ